MKTMETLLATSIISTVLLVSASVSAADKTAVKITPDMASVDVMHNGKKATITRNQDQKNTVKSAFAKTSRSVLHSVSSLPYWPPEWKRLRKLRCLVT